MTMQATCHVARGGSCTAGPHICCTARAQILVNWSKLVPQPSPFFRPLSPDRGRGWERGRETLVILPLAEYEKLVDQADIARADKIVSAIAAGMTSLYPPMS